MGEERAGLNPARPDAGRYKGTTQPSLCSGYLSYTSAAALYGSQKKRVSLHIFIGSEDVYS